MNNITANTGRKKRLFRKAVFFTLIYLLALAFFPLRGFAGEEHDPVLPYDEILVFMNVQGVGSAQIPAAIRNEAAYLSVTDVFDFVKIRNIPSQGLDSITGFIISPQSPFVIDKAHNRIEYQGKIFDLSADAFIRNTTSLYLRSDYFGLIFGLRCRFTFRSLSVLLSTSLELPVIREMRQEAMRNNIGKLKGTVKADTTIQRSYPLFKFGMADWLVLNTRDVKDKITDSRLNLTLGGTIAGGETSVSLNYRSTLPFNERQQYYQWRYVNNDNKAIRQVLAGKVFTPSVSSLFAPVVGVQFTNAPAVYRRSFGTYTLTYYAEAGWIAELYVNNTLVDYAKSEVTGPAHFQVPLVYGSSVVKIRFYSPWGEERTSEQSMQIPFNFLPQGEFQYTAAAGIVQDSINSRFGRIAGNYGLTKRLTIGAGLEYLSSVTTGKTMPFANASLRLGSNFLFSGEYTNNVRSKITGSYRLPSNLQIELNYTRYKAGQTAISNSFLEERKAVVTYPFRAKKFALFSKFSIYQIVLPEFKTGGRSKYTTAEMLLSGVIFGVNTNFTTASVSNGSAIPYLYSTLSMAFRLPAKILFTPQLQYEYNGLSVTAAKAEIGKYINSRGYLNLYFENNYKTGYQNAGIGLRYDFSFAITGFSFTRGSKGAGSNTQSASGSLLYDGSASHISLNNRNSVGNAVIKVVPFLDINGNKIRDAGEPSVDGVGVSINGGRMRYIRQEKTILVTDLEAYATYLVKLSETFDNLAWSIQNKTIRITVSPNQVTVIEVPVSIINEVAGMVYLQDDGIKKPLSGIIVDFYNLDFTPAGKTVTGPDGSFSFSGLPPGDYTARINTAQMEKLHMLSAPLSLPVSIKTNKEGDFVDGLDFILRPTLHSSLDNK